MKLSYCAFAFLLATLRADPAHAATSIVPEPARHEVQPMNFAECGNVIQKFKESFGIPHVVFDTPTLRVVQFAVADQTEQIACDGDSNLITVFEVGN